jgi:hypothetical protein
MVSRATDKRAAGRLARKRENAKPVYDSEVGRALRRHWPFGILLTAGLVLRVCAVVAYRPALVYIDTVRYLGGDSRGLDPLGYSYLLLRPVLLLGGGLAGVAAVQHALGLAMGVALYAAMIRYGAPNLLACLAAAPVLLDAYQVQAEQMIMPDTGFEALAVAALVLLLWVPVPRPGRLAAAAALLGISATVRQVGELFIVPLLGYVLAAAPGWRPRAIGAVTAATAFALPIAGYMALSAAVLGNGFRLSNMDDAYLYGRVAHAADCGALRIPESERPLCPPPAIARSRGVDGLATDPASPVFRYEPPPGVRRATAIAQFDEAVLIQQPLRVAGDITADAIRLFALTRNTAQGGTPVSRWQFQAAYPVYRAADRAVLRAQPRVARPLAVALRAYQLHGGYTPGPLLLAFFFSGTAAAFSLRRHRRLALGCLLATGLAVAAVFGADLYEFSWRYQLPALVTLPVAGALGATVASRSLVTWRSGSRGRMIQCILTMLTPRSGQSPAASSTPTPGSGSARTTSNAATGPAERTPS